MGLERLTKGNTVITEHDKPLTAEGCENCVHGNCYLTEILEEKGYLHNDLEDIYVSALESWVENTPTYYKWAEWEEWYGNFEESFQGWYDNTEEFTDNLAEEFFKLSGTLSELAQYFDYAKWNRDCFLGDYWESEGNIFRANQ